MQFPASSPSRRVAIQLYGRKEQGNPKGSAFQYVLHVLAERLELYPQTPNASIPKI
jgi:hypothetical protein